MRSELIRNALQGSAPCLDATLSELQDLASRQQQQISTQQHLLASKVHPVCF